MSIFRHHSGRNELEVLAHPREIEIYVAGPDDPGSVVMNRETVLRLHLALGEWLHPQNLGPTNGQLATAVKALADAINGAATAVRPLWGPRGQYVDAQPEPAREHRPQECPGAPECEDEPPPCGECTHSYRMHRGGFSRCTHPAGCDCPRYRSTP